jgi:hypothetical protein
MSRERKRQSRQCAPFSVHEVEQVVITPRSQAMQTATHCFMSFGLYGVYSLFAQFPIEPVTSLLSGVQQVNAIAATAIANTARMLTASLVPALRRD